MLISIGWRKSFTQTNVRKLQDVCVDPGLDISMSDELKGVMSTIVGWDEIMAGLEFFGAYGVSVGSTTALLAEANDAAATDAPVEDGMSGDVNFPHGNLKVLATAGERSVCPGSYGLKLTGPPDGVGAYLLDDNTIRIFVQSEGYGPLGHESLVCLGCLSVARWFGCML